MSASFLRLVEAELQTVSQEARRSIPAVKEAAERVLADTRKSTQALSSGAVSLDLARHGPLLAQLLQPFLLACNHVDAPKRLLTSALAGIQRFVTSDLVPPAEYANIVRVLEIQVRPVAGHCGALDGALS